VTTASQPLTNGAAHPAPSPPPRLEARGLSKRFGSLQALSDVSMSLKPGCFRALLGENGAGKSTLVKCIMGVYRSDTGAVIVGEQSFELKTPRQAHALGIGMVYQHFTLVENMTVVENLVMAREHVPAVINWKDEADKLAAFMDRMPFKVNPRATVRHLAAGEKQKAEILKQLYLQRKVLILDEPTSVLTPQEADEVLAMIRGMCTEGRISALMITHKFSQVMSFCDEATVLRHGKFMGEGSIRDLDPKRLSEMMMGTASLPEQAVRVNVNGHGEAAPLLEIKDLTADDETGVEALSGINLTVRPHEIVGIAGVSGNGQRELVQVLAGQRLASGGHIRVNGHVYNATREEIHQHDFHVLPEMPLQNACVGNMSTAENLAFRHFDRAEMTWARWFLKGTAMRGRATDLIKRFNVRPPWPATPIRTLSGGNIQRAVLARELAGDVKVLVAANPCFGLDFKSVAEIRSRIMQARNHGASVLLVSEDLDEILELADRVLVISDGKIVYETPIQSADRQMIGRYMAGHGHLAHAGGS
jgi:simple sugar transport system ATP-binding protein